MATEDKAVVLEDSSMWTTDESDFDEIIDPASATFPMASSPWLPEWLVQSPVLPDQPESLSSMCQVETAEECLPFLLNGHSDPAFPLTVNAAGVRKLDRAIHIKYLRAALGNYPGRFAGYDASRPWLIYWSLTGLALLGVNIQEFRESVIATFKPLQNASGGFGGGHGQLSHIATTYATVLSLATIGGDEALDLVDRKAMWEWMGRLKNPDGSFSVGVGGEIDVRAAYCALVVLSLLNIPNALPPSSFGEDSKGGTFLDGLAEWLTRCQTFEGGMSSAPGGEAHGAYTFCTLASFCILGKPHQILNKHLDIPSLLSWLASRQHAPEGGLAGRTNKLVDGCYSHWQGGCWSLVEAALRTSPGTGEANSGKESNNSSIFNREGLIRYILCCCQADRGGLRDKPSKAADAYHSCYNLAGLSSMQNYYYYQSPSECQPDVMCGAFYWRSSKVSLLAAASSEEEAELIDEDDRVGLINPVYVIPEGMPEKARRYYEARPLN